jgi:hypothetical protein
MLSLAQLHGSTCEAYTWTSSDGANLLPAQLFWCWWDSQGQAGGWCGAERCLAADISVTQTVQLMQMPVLLCYRFRTRMCEYGTNCKREVSHCNMAWAHLLRASAQQSTAAHNHGCTAAVNVHVGIRFGPSLGATYRDVPTALLSKQPTADTPAPQSETSMRRALNCIAALCCFLPAAVLLRTR